MKKRRVKNSLNNGRGRPQKHPKGLTRRPHEDVSDGGSDVDPNDFYHDEIDDFHNDQEKMLLGDDKDFNAGLSSGEEEEIMPISDGDDDEEEEDDLDEEAAEEFEDEAALDKSDMESDLEDKSDEDDGLPSLSAWGRKKSAYYGADFVDKDRGKSYRQEDEEKAIAEEEAGKDVWKAFSTPYKLEALDLEEFKDEKELAEVETETISKDLTNLSKEDHKQHLKKNSPEFFWLVDDFKNLMKELTERISPLFKLVEGGQISGKAAEYIRVKRSLILHYCMNISFYMMLKSNNTSVKYHPVMKRLSQYRKFLNQSEDIDKKLKSEIDFMLEKLKNGEKIEFISEIQTEGEEKSLPVDSAELFKPATSKRFIEEDTTGILRKSKKQKVEKENQFETEIEKEVSSQYMKMKSNQRDAKLLLSSDDEEDDLQDDEYDLNNSKDVEEFDNEDGDDEAVGDEKRTITYEIAKNKGLLPYRKKEYRNPRVRNRMKFRKAKIRRKGQVREPRKELTRYGGELTGIRTDVSRSIKIK